MMLGWIISLIWLGGIGAAYSAERRAQQWVIGSLLYACFWPLSLGHRVAHEFYTTSRKRIEEMEDQ